MQPKTIMFRGNRLAVVYGRYASNNRQAIRLVDAETGEPYLVATVNIPEVDIQEDEVLIKDHSENAGILAALESAGVVRSTGQYIATGYVHVTVCKLVANPERADGDDECAQACADDEDGADCAHDWVYTGTAYGGDDESFRGEGRVFCRLCGADGDA